MSDSLNEFQRKIKNRQFAIDHSWRGSLVPTESPPASDEDRLERELNQNLGEANACSVFDGYLPISSHRKVLGGLIVFCKRAKRKLLKIFWGWYIFPLYERLTRFHGKMINVVTLQRDLTEQLCRQIATLQAEVKTQKVRISTMEQALVDATQQYEELKQALIDATQQHEKTERTLMDTTKRCAALDERLKKAENLPTDDDEFYHCFEEKFRGPADLIRDRLRVYLPVIQEHMPDWSLGRFIDIGSGRGEWLDLLKENGASDYVGVDLNQRQNAVCAARGHRVVCEDCICYLTEQPEDSVDLVTGFQIIEHLAMSDLMELLRQSFRVLKPGGMVLIETQNPHNLNVGADTFFIDPSHKRVLPPELTSFLAEWAGFGQIRCIDANSYPNWAGVPTEENQIGHEIIQQFNNINFKLFGPQDYAIFAVKE